MMEVFFMPFDAPVVACLAQEIDRLLPVKIDKIYQPLKDEFLFSCYGGGEAFKLLISLNPKYARFHRCDDTKVNPLQPSSFCMLLRKYFGGSKLTAIQAIPFERILKLSFEVYDPLEGLSQKYIWIEFTGKTANLIVTNEQNRIIDCWRRSYPKDSGDRDLSAGSPYELPPTGGRWKPVTISAPEFTLLMAQVPSETSVESFLLKHWYGLSSPSLREILHTSGLDQKSQCGELLPEQAEALYRSFSDWADALAAGKYQPSGLYDEQGKLQDFMAFTPHYPLSGYSVRPLPSLNAAVVATINFRHDLARLMEAKSNLLRKIRNLIEKNAKKLEKQKQEAAAAEQSDHWRIIGELLTTYGYQIPKGATETSVVNYYDPEGNTILIPLNPALSAQENAQVYFKKYQKAKKGQIAIAEQIAKTQETLDYLESLEAMAETGSTLEDLALIQEELEEKTDTPLKKKPGTKPGKTEAPAKPRQYVTPAGHTLLVGRNNIQNDRLTFKIAGPNDWWFHTQKIPGSHVILKLLPGTEVDDETLNYACQLAVFFSKARHSTKVAVDYTQRKHVKKPPASKPGFVIYDDFKTAIITPDPYLLNTLGIEEEQA